MKWQDTLIDGFSRISELLDPAVKGLTREDLDRRPCEDCNSIGWITWHLIRGEDAQIASLMGEEQVWIQGKWYLKFNLPAAPRDTGYGHSSAQVAAFKSPDPDVLLGYYKAAFEQTKRYLSGLTLKDLDRQLDETWYNPPPTVGVRIVSIMADSLQHSGEIAYLRGLLKGKGWLD
jgi:hypothetical protein